MDGVEEPSARIVLVEDQTIFRELLAEVLGANPDWSIVGQFSEGQPALSSCASLSPDLVILDAVLPDVAGIEVLTRLLETRPRLKVLMVTAHARPALVQQAVAQGARGFVTKGTPLRELREAVRQVLLGGRYFCSETSALMAEALRRPASQSKLTARQREIVRLVANGASSKEIAEELGISLKTVANHRLQIRQRLGLPDIASWTRYAIEQGLVEPKA